MRILVTGFMPFGGQKINPSWEAIKTLEGKKLGAQLLLRRLPVEWEAGPKELLGAIREFRPDCVLLVGQAGGRDAVSVERLGVNCQDCKAPDNAGEVRLETPIREGAPDALAATYPFEEILAALRGAGIPARYSWDAGRYLCNCVLWTALDAAREDFPGMRAGFIHLPFLPGQKEGAPCLDLETQARAVELCVRAIAGAER